MDKKPGGFLQRIARMPKAIKSAAQAIPIIGALSGNVQPANSKEIIQAPISQAEQILPDAGIGLEDEARNIRTQILDNQGLLKMSEDEYDKYFAKGQTKQGNTGNCYAISAIDALHHSPQFEAMARSSMRKNPDGSWDISMPLMNDDGRKITVTQKEMGEQKNPFYMRPNSDYDGEIDDRRMLHGAEAPEGIRALETAYIKATKGTDEYGVVDRAMSESGSPYSVFKSLGGDNFESDIISGPDTKDSGGKTRSGSFSSEKDLDKRELLNEYLNKFNPDIDTATAGTLKKTTDKQLYGSHAYILRDTDPSKKTVTLINPHDTSKNIEITYQKFKENFNQIQSLKPNNPEILKNMDSIKSGKEILEDRRFQEPHHSSLEKPQEQNIAMGGSEYSSQNKRALQGAPGTSARKKDQEATGTTTPTQGFSKKSSSTNPPLLRSTPPITRSAGSTINTSFTLPQIITETPGSQDVHDEITQTYTQPSPSFTPARVLNRQFVRRPIGGGGGRIPSLARRSGNKMMGRLGMQAGRMGAQLAAQAAIQTSRLLLNPYVLGAILILLLIIMMVFIVIQMTTGGAVEEKKVSGTGESCGPVTYKGSMNNLTDSEARAQLKAAGFGNDSIKAGVSLEGIKQNTICGIINFKNESGLNNIVITSGTDGQHSTRGTYTHINGFKLDLRINPQIDNYIRSNYRQGATRRDGAAYYIGPRGNGFYREGDHWDIAFTGSNCHNMTEGQIADPNADQNKCDQTAADQNTPENTVLSVQDCSEKWASDISSNPLRQNFGDPDCDFDQTALYTLLTELDPNQADHWFNTVIKKESGYRPNYYSKSSSGNNEKWGLFRMDNGASNPVNSGNTNWRQQVINAVAFCRELNSKQISCACYWESWGESCNIKR